MRRWPTARAKGQHDSDLEKPLPELRVAEAEVARECQSSPVVTDWLAHEAKSRAFIAAEQKRLQGDLFSCAERHDPSPRKPPRPPSNPR